MAHVRLCLALLALSACVTDDDATTTDTTTSELSARPAFAFTEGGALRGSEAAGLRAFRGIPYAAPPVGAQRWRPPERAARWTGIRDATQFAPHCAQITSPFGQASSSEDCLYLNVYAPSHPRFAAHPVMVWIHGGALITGESDDYDAARLVDQGDVIVVTINYRLGALGFTAHPALTAESPQHASGNYGLMDQQAALRWVQRNIAGFGGDPTRVTIFGESAGGLSVHSQLVSPTSAGLFHRAIVESGAYALTQPDLATGEALGAAFAAAAGCADQTAACLRGLSVAQILAAQANSRGGASPVIDHVVLTRSIGEAFATGAFHRVPVIEGSNHDEWRLFVGTDELTSGPLSASNYPAAIAATLGVPAPVAAAIEAQYPLASFASPALALGALGTDAIFTCNARFAAQQLARFTPTFAYEFNDEHAPERFLPPVSFPYGAAHASEIQYLFTLPEAVPAPALDAQQQRLSRAMIDAWTTFARTGHPGHHWATFHDDVFQSLVPPGPRPEASFAAAHQCAFWDAILR